MYLYPELTKSEKVQLVFCSILIKYGFLDRAEGERMNDLSNFRWDFWNCPCRFSVWNKNKFNYLPFSLWGYWKLVWKE